MRVPHSLMVAWLVAASAVSGLAAQRSLWSLTGYRQGGVSYYFIPLRDNVCAIPDVDGDGFDDIVISMLGTPPFEGVWTCSGRDGSVLRILPLSGGRVVSAGDSNGDGYGDYVTVESVGLQCFVQVRSGVDDAVIWQYGRSCGQGFGGSLEGDLDVDGDGRPDVIAGEYLSNTVYVLSSSGELLYTLSEPALPAYGRSVARVGDVDGDGCDDFVVGSDGVIVLHSGKTGHELVRGISDPRSNVGYSVMGCGDLDGDGLPDFGGGSSGGFGSVGMMQVFSSRTGQAIYTWLHPTQPLSAAPFGGSPHGSIDVDLDGVKDVLTGAAYPTGPVGSAVLAYSGRDGSEVLRLDSSAGFEPSLIGVIGPQPGDPFPRLLIQSKFTMSSINVRSLHVYSTRLRGVSQLGTPCAGTLARAPRIGIRSLAPTPGARIHLSDAEPGAAAWLVLGLSKTSYAGLPLPYPLPFLAGCFQRTSVEALVPATTGLTGLGSGYASADLPWPLSGGLGLTLHGQWLVLGSGPTAPGGMSAAMTWTH